MNNTKLVLAHGQFAVVWGLPYGNNDPSSEMRLNSRNCWSLSDVEEVKSEHKAYGWHSFRCQVFSSIHYQVFKRINITDPNNWLKALSLSSQIDASEMVRAWIEIMRRENPYNAYCHEYFKVIELDGVKQIQEFYFDSALELKAEIED